jgi:hypothetical protein
MAPAAARLTTRRSDRPERVLVFKSFSFRS